MIEDTQKSSVRSSNSFQKHLSYLNKNITKSKRIKFLQQYPTKRAGSIMKINLKQGEKENA